MLCLKINVTYDFTAKNIAQKVVWNTKHKLMQLVIHLVQHTLHISMFVHEKHSIQRSLSGY